MKKGKGFSVKSISDFFVNHTEKCVAALAVLVLLFLVYTTIGRQTLDWGPDDLNNAANLAKTNIETREVPLEEIFPEDIKNQEKDWATEAGRSKMQVPRTPYEFDMETPLNPSLLPQSGKRTVPTVLPLDDLRAKPGLGAIRVTKSRGPGAVTSSYESYDDYGYGSEGGGEVEGRRWIVLTGLIPIAAQTTIYKEIFAQSSAFDPGRDRPTYVDLVIERAEGGEVDASGQPLWKPLDAKTLTYAEVKQWAPSRPVLVERQFKHPFPRGGVLPMAMDLPPIPTAGKRFGNEIAHPPEIPLLTDTAIERLKEQMEEQKERASEVRPDQLFGRSGGGGYSGEEYDSEYDSEYYDSDYDGSEYGYSGARGREPVKIDHQLFRYFDFTVEPGKVYQYRVRLVMANPNYKVAEEHLEDPTQARVETLQSDFCAPSRPVTMPLDSRLLAVNVAGPNKPIDEPNGTLCCVYFDMEKAIESSGVFKDIRRGKVANFKNEPINTPTPMSSGYEEYSSDYDGDSPYPDEGYPSRGGRRGGRRPAARQVETIDYMTNVCVLDMLGGEKLPCRDPSTVGPGRFLMLSSGGDLAVREEFEDYEEYLEFKPVERRRQRGYEFEEY